MIGLLPALKRVLVFLPQPALTPEKVSREEQKVHTCLGHVCPRRTIQSQVPMIDQQPVEEGSQQRGDN